MVGKQEWVSGTPPDNVFFQTWWVWDGNNVFLAHWKRKSKIWELAEPSFYHFEQEKIIAYHALKMPDKPYSKGKENG